MLALLSGTRLTPGALASTRGLQHLASRRPLVVRSAEGERQQQGEAAAPAAPPAAPAPSVRVPPQQRGAQLPTENVEVKRVEQRGDSRFSGVVSLDRGQAVTSPGRVALLVAGDAAALLLFASIGRLAHGEGLSLVDALGTAWPFMAGWYGAAYLLDGYGKAAQGGDVGAAAAAAAKPWAAGIPAGLLLRTASRGYLPEPTFIAVSLAATGVFLVGWRATLAAATEEAPAAETPAEQLRGRKDRKGNVLEMFSMLTSLVKRW